MNLSMLLEMACEAMGDRVAVGSRSDGVTYEELLERVQRTARFVVDADVDRVGLLDVNSEMMPLLVFASGVAGVPFAPVNYRLADDRLRSVAERLAPALLVSGPDVRERIDEVHGLTLLTGTDLLSKASSLEPLQEGRVDPDAVAVWLFTSGTTGEPKVALLRHRHLVAYVLSTVQFMAADESECTLVSVPPYHIAAVATILSNTYAGRRIVYLPQFDARAWVTLAELEAVTHAMVVPTMLGRILDVVDEGRVSLSSLRHLSYGGGRMPVPTVERAMRLLPGVNLVNAYGLTETSSTVAVLGPEDHRDAFSSDDASVRARLGSVGRPLPSIELQIRGATGEVLPPGATGEIFLRGDQVAGEYHGRSVLTDDGWFPTNDAGHVDDAGYLFVEGRLDDVIVRGAENLSPGEIEDVLLEHPEVNEAAVTGIPDDDWGETVAAAVVLVVGARVEEEELKTWVRERLRSSRTPVIIDVRSELPYNATGKLLRRVLSEELSLAAVARQ